MDELKGNKKKIYDFIEKNPGKHMREIKRSLDLPMGDIQYNLYSLEKLGYIVSLKKGLYKRYYTRNMFTDKEKGIIAIISNESVRKILLMLMKRPGSTQSDLVIFTGLTSPTVSWHMKRLIEENVLKIEKDGRNIRYYIRNPEDIERLMKIYYPSFWERWADNFAEVWSELFSFRKKEEKRMIEEVGIDWAEMLRIGSGIFSLILFAISLYAYMRNRDRRLLFVSGAFGLYFVRIVCEHLDIFIQNIDLASLDLLLSIMDFLILILFFLAIVYPRK